MQIYFMSYTEYSNFLEQKRRDKPDRCDLYMVYHNEPDNTLHLTELENRTAVQEIHRKVEEQISYLISSLG